VVVPDLAFVTTARRSILGERTIEGAPDIVVEILSPSPRDRDERVRRDLYAAHGVPEYWLLDPDVADMRALRLVGGRYQPIPLTAGRLQSVTVPQLLVDVEALYAELG